VLRNIMQQKGIPAEEIVFIGNDVNDLGCLELAGYAVVPADAEPKVIRSADLVLNRKGGRGAVREFCDMLLERFGK